MNTQAIDPKLFISGDAVFYTLQGEGPSIGQPAVFIRLHHCNLTCVWCDTPYTWKRDLPEYRTERQTWLVSTAVAAIRQAAGQHCRRLVITGGEPLLQAKSLVSLVAALPDWQIEIETNGTIVPPEGLHGCQFNCSPKLSNSGMGPKTTLKPHVLSALNSLNTWFKFVVSSVADIDEMEQLFLPLIDRDKVILSPQATDEHGLIATMQQIAEVAKERGYRLLPRLQVFLWGNTRRT